MNDEGFVNDLVIAQKINCSIFDLRKLSLYEYTLITEQLLEEHLRPQ